MKCQECGHDYPSTITRCTRCGHTTPKRGQRSSQSRLIEFPRKARATADNPTQDAALPAWRVEVSERVRQARARRQVDSPTSELDYEQLAPQPAAEIREKAQASQPVESNPRSRKFPPRETSSFTPPGNRPLNIGGAVEAAPALEAPVRGASRDSSEIREAALTRARRASETANRAALPRTEPARAMGVDKQATARALEPTVELTPRMTPPPVPLPKDDPAPVTTKVVPSPSPSSSPAPAPSTARASEPVRTAPLVSSPPVIDDLDSDISFIGPLDEIEPVDYLTAEVRKVDQALNAEFAKNESPSLFAHAVIWVVDLLVVSLSCAPFIALIQLVGGNFASPSTLTASTIICLMIALLYFSITHALGGKTFGMMLTNTRIVDAYTFEPPSGQRALVRAAGSIFSVAPALLGVVLAVFNRKHRGLQDFISGTMVVRDF